MVKELKKELPSWVRLERISQAEEIKKLHGKVIFMEMLIPWEEYLEIKENYGSIEVYEQRDGDAWVKVMMTEFETFEYAAWRHMDKSTRLKRECFKCTGPIPPQNQAFCSERCWHAYMRREFRQK